MKLSETVRFGAVVFRLKRNPLNTAVYRDIWGKYHSPGRIRIDVIAHINDGDIGRVSLAGEGPPILLTVPIDFEVSVIGSPHVYHHIENGKII
jgi:hypothetical protein